MVIAEIRERWKDGSTCIIIHLMISIIYFKVGMLLLTFHHKKSRLFYAVLLAFSIRNLKLNLLHILSLKCSFRISETVGG